MNIKNKNILILGLGLSGRAAARFLLKRMARVAGIDRSLHKLKAEGHLKDLTQIGLRILDGSEGVDIHSFDMVIVSPGVPKTESYYQAARDAKIEIIGEMELACRFISKKVIAITGTNGKTTTTLLTTHVLNAHGKKARALGNIGVPLLEEIDQEHSKDENEILVVEMSSFQLETLATPIIDAGVILNITPDHLDRYHSMEEYAAAKIRMKDCLKKTGKLIVEEKCYRNFQSQFKTAAIDLFGYSPLCNLYCDSKAVFLDGQRQWDLPKVYYDKPCYEVDNWMAAFFLCTQMGVSGDEFVEAAQAFVKPPHRVEFVRTVGGIDYYDDSKGTNLDAVIKAVKMFENEIILIAGGVDKGAPYTPWITEFNGNVKKILVIGQSAEKIHRDLSATIPVEICLTLKEAVENAAAFARPGQVVLLSPGCASFDQFRDYADRGEQFKKFVDAL